MLSRLFRPKGHRSAERIFPLYGKGQGGGAGLSRVGAGVSGDHNLIRANENDFDLVKQMGVKGNGYFGFLLRLSYF